MVDLFYHQRTTKKLNETETFYGVEILGALCQCPCSGDQIFPSGTSPEGWGINSVDVSGGVGLNAVGASCQCPCSVDQALPSGAGPGGGGVCPVDGSEGLGLIAVGASCQCPWSGAQTFPGGGLLVPLDENKM